MPDYQRSLTISATPDDLFEFLSDVENLPKYFSGLTEAHPATGDEVHVVAELSPEQTGGDAPKRVESNASFEVDAEQRAIRWGTPAENPHHYHGELSVSPAADGATVKVTLHTEHDDDEAINKGIDDTLQNVAEQVAARPSLQD